jgi:nucleotide-binding universal stress UspA family protein
MDNIVLGYDDSEASQRALERAAELVKALGSKLAVISVAPLAAGGARGGGGVDSIDSPAKHAAELDQARAYLEKEGITADYEEPIGDPADAIIEMAIRANADLIVVGTREPSTLARLFGQSVSDSITHKARCDVLVVH